MEPVAQAYEAEGFAFVFVYTREAHPGESFPAHRTMEQKLSHARAFKEQYRVHRPILVDDLMGTGHRLYGNMSNMTYLLGRGGKVLFRSDWTDPPTIEVILRYILDVRSRRREGLHLAPFYAEMVGYRWSDPVKHDEGMLRGGQQAMDDYQRELRRRREEGR